MRRLMDMFCPNCKSGNIIELQPIIIKNEVRDKSVIPTWSPDDNVKEVFPAFNFQCKDCDTKFNVNHN